MTPASGALRSTQITTLVGYLPMVIAISCHLEVVIGILFVMVVTFVLSCLWGRKGIHICR